MLKADDLLPDSSTNGNAEDWLKDLGSRRTPQINLKPDPDAFDILGFENQGKATIKKEKEDDNMDIDDPMDVDDLPGKLDCIVFWLF